MKRKHGLSLFVASCIPGCGQMHQGYMKRGASLLTAFCGVFALAVFLEVGALAVLMIPLWLYSFFDSYNLRAQTDEEAAANPDAYLFGLSDMDAEQMGVLLRKRHSVIGWGLVLVGLWLLWQRVADWLDDVFQFFFPGYSFYYQLHYNVPRLLVTILIIALGVWFIRGPRKAKGGDIPAFTPPPSEPQRAPASPAEPQAAAAPQAEEPPAAEPAGTEQEGPHGDC